VPLPEILASKTRESGGGIPPLGRGLDVHQQAPGVQRVTDRIAAQGVEAESAAVAAFMGKAAPPTLFARRRTSPPLIRDRRGSLAPQSVATDALTRPGPAPGGRVQFREAGSALVTGESLAQ
jgi:hypothetical protein